MTEVGLEKNNKIRFALIGCGAIAKKHVHAIGSLGNAKIVGAYDVNPRSVQAFAKKNGFPVFDSAEEMILKTDPHVLNILTPSGMHGDNILDLVQYNRHFVVEKPMALRLEQIDQILEECDRRGLKVFVVKQNRFNPPIKKMKEAVVSGRFGKIVLGTVRVRWCRKQSYYDEKPWRGTWAYDGGVLTNQASHHIDMLVWMLGDVRSVMAKTATQLVNIEAEDTGVAIINFTSGALGLIEATTATRPKDLEGSISLLGEKGVVEVGGFFMNELKTWNFADSEEKDGLIWDEFKTVPNEFAWNQTEFFKDVVKSLISGGRALVDGFEGRKSVELINAIYESAETGREVFIKFMPQDSRLGLAK